MSCNARVLKQGNHPWVNPEYFAADSSSSSESQSSSSSGAGTGDAATTENEELDGDTGPISQWFKMTRPEHTPYSPQLGDDLVYFYQGHLLYLNQVKDRKLYPVDVERDAPWSKYNYIKVSF